MRRMRGVKRHAVSIVFTFCILLLNLGFFYNYYTATEENLNEQTKNYLNNIVQEVSQCIDIKIEERFNTLEALALYIAGYTSSDYEETFSVLDAQMTMDGFSDYDIISTEFVGLEEKGNIDYSQYDFVTKSLNGKNTLGIVMNEYGEEYAIGFAVPIKSEEETMGVFLSVCTFDAFSKFADVNSFGQDGSTFIVDKTGSLYTRGNGLDEVNNIKLILSDDERSANNLVSSMKQKSIGNVSYGTDNLKRYLCFSQISYNKWYAVTIVSAEGVEEHVGKIKNQGVTFIVEISILFLMLIMYFVYLVASQIKSNRINKQRYFIVADNSETILFDYSIKKDTMFCNEKWKDIFGYELPKTEMKSIKMDYVFEEDKPKFERRIGRINKTNDFVKFSIRLMNSDNEPIMCFVKLYAIRGFWGKYTKIIGVIEALNIEDKKTENKEV